MLYAYLLTRSEFQIESAPAKNTRDARYAYSLYLDLLLIILELSGCKAKPGAGRSPLDGLKETNPLAGSALSKALSSDLSVRELIAKGSPSLDSYDPVLQGLYHKIIDSEVYADYRKKKGRKQLSDDVKLWTVLLPTVLEKDASLNEAARKNEEYTSAGFRQAFLMVSHTLNDFVASSTSLADARKSLDASLDKAYELYVSMLALPVLLTDLEAERIDAAKEKYCPTPEELNPNMRFVRNGFVEAVRNSEAMEAFAKNKPNAFAGDYYMLKDILEAIKKSEIYQEYMAAEVTTFRDDCEFWRHILKNVVFPGDALAEAMENKSIYWNDDLAIMGTFTLKTIKQMANSDSHTLELLPVFKNDDDAHFGPDLFIAAVNNREEYREYIDRFINDAQWDSDRLAFTDIVILIAAIAELLNFPSIPVPVTLNEYIEIANYYSTARSGQFINGVLYSVVNYLKEEGKLLK